MSPITKAFGALALAAWFVGMPFVVAASTEPRITILGGFAIVWGSTAAVVLMMGALVAQQLRWSRKRGRRQ